MAAPRWKRPAAVAAPADQPALAAVGEHGEHRPPPHIGQVARPQPSTDTRCVTTSAARARNGRIASDSTSLDHAVHGRLGRDRPARRRGEPSPDADRGAARRGPDRGAGGRRRRRARRSAAGRRSPGGAAAGLPTSRGRDGPVRSGTRRGTAAPRAPRAAASIHGVPMRRCSRRSPSNSSRSSATAGASSGCWADNSTSAAISRGAARSGRGGDATTRDSTRPLSGGGRGPVT